jgi:AraC-like DNA-binding protein/mannose-6-phosphate isomerase-like protein (cupin superfamily)
MIQNSFSKLSADAFMPYPYKADDNFIKYLLTHITVTPRSAIYYKCNPDWKLLPRRLDNAYMTVLLDGRGTVIINGKSMNVKPNDIIVFPEACEHSFVPTGNCSLEMINIHFFARILGIIDVFKLTGANGVYVDECKMLTNTAYELARCFAIQPPGWNEFMTIQIKSLIIFLIYNMYNADPGKIPDVNKMIKIFPALLMIEQNLTSNELHPAKLAATCSISMVYLRRLFHELFDESPVKFITRCRIESACILLKESEYRIKEISAMTGFADLTFFYRIFHRLMGITPGEYQKKMDF